MKKLKPAAILLATAMASTLAFAGVDDVLNITLKNGAAAQCQVSEIEEVTFGDETIEPTNTQINGFKYVDLGLPSGLKWAACNVGAGVNYFQGFYFAWGETDTKGEYNIFKGRWCDDTYAELKENGVIDDAGNLVAGYDAATAYWGAPWRIPTKEEWQELKDCCTWTWSEDDEGLCGVYIVGPNGNSIFIPAAGNYHGFQWEHGRYWTATAFADDDRSWAFYFDNNSEFLTTDLRGTGIPVRAVADYSETEN